MTVPQRLYMLLLLRVLTIVIICIMAYLSINLLVQLHWLPISYCTVFKLLLLVYKSVNGLCPSYVSDLLKVKSSWRPLRSNSMDYLVQPVSKTKTYGDRAFSVCAPRLWNSIPFSIRKSSSVTIFKKNIKTFLFSKFVTSNSLLFNWILFMCIRLFYYSIVL